MLFWKHKKEKEGPLCYIDGHLSKHQKYKGRVVHRGDIVKKRLSCIRGIHRTRIVSFANDCCKGNGCNCEITRMLWTSSGRSISLRPGKNWRTLQCRSKFQSQSVQIDGYVLPRHKWPKSWSRRPCGSSRTTFVRTPACWRLVGNTL